MPAVHGFHHVAVHSRVYDESVRFYTEVLGLKQRVEFVLKGQRVSLLDSGGGAYVEIFDKPNRADGTSSCLVHFALRCREVDALIDRVRASGRKITVEPTSLQLETNVGPKPFGIRIAFFEGPDGESVELFDEQTPVDLA